MCDITLSPPFVVVQQEKRAEEVARETVLKRKMKAQEGVIEKNALQRSNLEK